VDSKDIMELMEYISRSNFAEFELEQDGIKLKLVKESARMVGSAAGQAPPPAFYPVAMGHAPGTVMHAAGGGSLAGATSAQAPHAAAPAIVAGGEIYQVTSPMVGTLYRAANPSAPPYVGVGDVVKKGQVLCLVEAMKLMNEIESEVAGEILEITAANGQPVEYGEVLFRIRLTPS